jgi:Holliday junction resolvase
MGLIRVGKRKIENLRRDAPFPGEFCERAVLGEDEADLVIGLYDHRILAVECKASNSEINSRKRINKEIAQNAQNWIRRFGSDDFVPAGVIRGVFKPAYLESAQEIPIVFFWEHRLEDLRDFVRSTAP